MLLSVRSLFAIASLLLVMYLSAFAGDSTYVESVDKIDTVLYQPTRLKLSASAVTDSMNYERRLYQNPTAALLKSMLVPGLGQLGNRQYVKAALVIGLQGWLISSAVHHGQETSDFRKQFEQSTDVNERNMFYDQYLDSKDNRNKFTWFAVIVTFVSMFDAYADAHLSGFPKEKEQTERNLSFDVAPQSDRGIYASITYSF